MKNIILVSTLLLASSAYGMYHDPFSSDPAAGINYTRAFDQSELQHTYVDLMHALGCADNVLPSIKKSSCTRTRSHHTERQPIDTDAQQMLQEYQHACLKQLHAERTWAIMQPAREGFSFVALLFAAGALLQTRKENHTDRGYGASMALVNSVYHLPQSIKSIYHFVYPPAHPLHVLEEQFARDRCFIPHTLWPTIEETFMLARQNQFEQRQSIDAITFALGLTIYKPKPPLAIDALSSDAITATLACKIKDFFVNYSFECDGSCIIHSMACKTSCTRQQDLITINIAKFIHALYSPTQDTMPRYIYLEGPGGIGKSYFTEQLHDWFEELLPGCIAFENNIVSSPEQLEGSTQQPGIFLRTLRTQLLAEKRGSIIFMDEANWLNERNMIAAAKRTFNGAQTTLSTRYFGDSIEKTGIELQLPPMLIIVAGNHAIEDPALKSRFDVMKYPLPTVEALTDYAHDTLQHSKVLLDNTILPSMEAIAQWITHLAIRDFRTVTSNVEQWAQSNNI